MLEHRQQVREVVGMLQKEVAERMAEGPGSKVYGILSVLLQAYYTVELLFLVPPHVFIPPPQGAVGGAAAAAQRHRKAGLRREAVL